MINTQLQTLALMRASVGFLGERDQFAWWQSTFFAPGSRAFVAPVFSRTQLVAQCMGVTRAAAITHDQHIGVGRVYHLFRLPEDVEQGIHRMLHNPELGQRIATLVASKDAALEYLRSEARAATGGGVGAVRIGDDQELRSQRHWRAVAAQYVAAFASRGEAYPYFTARA